MSRSMTCTFTLAALLAVGTPLRADDTPQPVELFQILDANGDGTLSDDEIGESQRQAFERLLRVGDADKDGRLTRQEYLKAFQPDPPVAVDSSRRGNAPGRSPRQPDFGRLFQSVDRDGDGKVALEDLPERMQDRMRPLFERLGRSQLTREDFERLDRMRPGQRTTSRPQFDAEGLFERLDKDDNGGISRDDLPEPLRRRFAPIFERLDKPELSRGDFERVMRQLSAESQADERSEQSMRPEAGRPLMAVARLLDTDRDGQLTTAELDRLSMAFTEVDADGDGKLSGAELVRFAGHLRPGEVERPGGSRGRQTQRSRRPDSTAPAPE